MTCLTAPKRPGMCAAVTGTGFPADDDRSTLKAEETTSLVVSVVVARGGSVYLNSFGRFVKWISASIMRS
ncbi:hypothetical protein [Agrobacterium rosae]|uniref:hypothetical protein n=1 Tax=Agrobacterium rosae TaxID=1972867 RepID=UPI003A7FC758